MPIGPGTVVCFNSRRGFINIEYEYEFGIRNTPAFGHELNATEHWPKTFAAKVKGQFGTRPPPTIPIHIPTITISVGTQQDRTALNWTRPMEHAELYSLHVRLHFKWSQIVEVMRVGRTLTIAIVKVVIGQR